MVGIGEPKEAQWSNAGLLEMTWYTLLGGVSTRGGSAMEELNISQRHRLNQHLLYLPSHTYWHLYPNFKVTFFIQIDLNLC